MWLQASSCDHVTSVPLPLFGSNQSWATHLHFAHLAPPMPLSPSSVSFPSLLDFHSASLFNVIWSSWSQFLRDRPPVRPTSLTDLCVSVFSLLLSVFWCWSCFLNFLRDCTPSIFNLMFGQRAFSPLSLFGTIRLPSCPYPSCSWRDGFITILIRSCLWPCVAVSASLPF